MRRWALLAVALVGCGTPAQQGLEHLAYSRTQTWFNTAQRAIARTQTEFDAMWATSVSGVTPTPEAPAVDFTKKMVVLAALGQVNSANQTVDITAVVGTTDALAVELTIETLGTGCGTLGVVTFPIDMVKADRSELTPDFRETRQTKTCP